MIIGCDYSTKAVHLSWLTENMWHFESTLADPFQELQDLLQTVSGAIYLERPWTRNNVYTGMQLTRIATIIEVLAVQRGLSIEWVATHAWRSAIFGKGKYTRAVAKKLAIAKVKDLAGIDVDDNTADATCISLYGMAKCRA